MRGRWSFDWISDAIHSRAEKGSLFRKTVIVGLALANALAFTALTPLPAAAQGKVKVKVSHNHWQNGGLAKNQLFPKDFSFVNGNLNFVHNHYQEGDTVPLRWVMQDLKTSTNYHLTIEWDSTKKQGNGPVPHAWDYLRTYDASEANTGPAGGPFGPNPCEPLTEGGKDAICTLGTVADEYPIPTDPCVTNAIQKPGVFKIWTSSTDGADITGTSPYTLLNANGKTLSGCDFSGSTSTRITIDFTTGGPSGNYTIPYTVIAVGGHLASFLDWDSGGAGSISGSPWHTRLILLQNGGVVADASMDRSIQIRYSSRITVRKVCLPEGQAGGPFTIDVSGQDPLQLYCEGSGVDHDGIDVPFGEQVTIHEDVPVDWTLNEIACTTRKGTTFTVDSDNALVTFSPLPGDRIVCAIVNQFGGGGGGGGGGRKWMTGGGSVLENNITQPAGGNIHRVTHGFHLLCPNPGGKTPNQRSNNLEVNWIVADSSGNLSEYHFKLDGSTLTAICTTDGGDPRPPQTKDLSKLWDVYIGTGAGTVNGQPATATWTFTDHGEPGTLVDGMAITVTSQFGTVTITNAGATNATGNVESGNHQAHY